MIEHENGHPVCVFCRRDLVNHEEITMLNVDDKGHFDIDAENYVCYRCFIAYCEEHGYDERATDLDEIREISARIEAAENCQEVTA